MVVLVVNWWVMVCNGVQWWRKLGMVAIVVIPSWQFCFAVSVFNETYWSFCVLLHVLVGKWLGA